MSAQALAVFTRVSRSYGARRAVHDISFEIRRGEVLGLLGPNGAGKTSTMQMLCGVIAPSAGTITVNGHDIVEEPEAAKSYIGYLPEQPPLYPDQTVDQYLEYCALLRNVPRAQCNQSLRAARDRCGLGDVGGRRIGNLSKGYQQRAGIAQALLHDPELIVLDEPTVGLDPAQIVSIRALVRELGEDHGVLISTHILPEVRATCDRVVIIGGGAVLLDRAVVELDSAAQREFAIALRTPPPLEVLRGMAGVAGVEQLDAHRFRVTTRDGADAAPDFAAAAANNGWGLFELVPGAGSLEDVYLRLTSHDAMARQDRTPLC